MRNIYVATNDKEREIVRNAQRTLQVPITGDIDEATRMKIRGVQWLFKLPVTGILDVKTLDKIDEMRNSHG
jgi:hypothetical protein